MIRFLQRDNRLTKALFVVIIAAASVSMVVYLIPGLAAGGAVSESDYAIVYRTGTTACSRMETRSFSNRWN